MVRRFGTAWILVQVAVLAIAACTPASRTNSTTTTAPYASQAAARYVLNYRTIKGNLLWDSPQSRGRGWRIL